MYVLLLGTTPTPNIKSKYILIFELKWKILLFITNNAQISVTKVGPSSEKAKNFSVAEVFSNKKCH